MNTAGPERLLRTIRFVVGFFIAALVVSGLTAFPLVTELRVLSSFLGIDGNLPPESYSGLKLWIATVGQALAHTDAEYPFLLYGTDWLAFAHLVIAVAFVGLYRDPVRNKWLITFGMIACFGILPLALICGPLRGIPFYWQLIDCAFGVFGLVPLLWLRVLVKKLERMQAAG